VEIREENRANFPNKKDQFHQQGCGSRRSLAAILPQAKFNQVRLYLCVWGGASFLISRRLYLLLVNAIMYFIRVYAGGERCQYLY